MLIKNKANGRVVGILKRDGVHLFCMDEALSLFDPIWHGHWSIIGLGSDDPNTVLCYAAFPSV